jgi:hypothetical protein
MINVNGAKVQYVRMLKKAYESFGCFILYLYDTRRVRGVDSIMINETVSLDLIIQHLLASRCEWVLNLIAL